MTTRLAKTIAPWLAAGILFVAATGCETGVEEGPVEEEVEGVEGVEGVEEEGIGEEGIEEEEAEED